MMTPEASYNSLLSHYRKITALEQISEILSWDQQTVMPKKGGKNRAVQLSNLSGVIHALRTDPKIPDYIDAAKPLKSESDSILANLEEAKKQYRRSNLVPRKLCEELALTTCLTQESWLEAKKRNDFSLFLPKLEEMVTLKQSEADCLRQPGTKRYDMLLNDFEPEENSKNLKELFSDLKPKLIELRDKVLSSRTTIPKLTGFYSETKQLVMAAKIAQSLGYDFSAGRIDQTEHPFCSGSNADDIRITTRIDEKDPFYCLFAIMHETGHALYEQGIPKKMAYEPIGSYASMGVHESQSRLIENHIGRSATFCEYTAHLLKKIFSEVPFSNANELFKMVNKVKNGFIRTEADELTYDLHIMLRFELEEKLIEGSLKPKLLEEAWNAKFLKDFGIAVQNSSQGVLQDIHWSTGAFGYFPTYTIGNIYAACLHEKINTISTNTEEKMSLGDISSIRIWLKNNIHKHGRKLGARDLIEKATGKKISVQPLLNHLKTKFSRIYEF